MMPERLHVTPLERGDSASFWVESTAPLNVEDSFEPRRLEFGPNSTSGFVSLAAAVGGARRVVIAVHGFNVPKWAAEKLFRRLAASAREKGDGTIFIGYRWPSESLFSNIGSGLYATPPTAVGLALLASLLLGGGIAAFQDGRVELALAAVAMAIVGCFATLWLIRSFVYFRDLDRATHHGIPDLVHLIRELDRRVANQRDGEHRIELSFIGHSMGALIAVGSIRLLTEVMSPVDASRGQVSPHFFLGHLVLVSPDIPVESILPRRSNWLEQCLREFRELHLFSNDGDIVLKMISTVANYIMTPVRFWANGYRLGNMAIVRPEAGLAPFGVVNTGAPEPRGFLDKLRLGWFTLWQRLDPIPSRGAWYDWFARRARLDPATTPRHTFPEGSVPLPMRISYFDCTDSIDGPKRLTRGKQKKELSLFDNWQLFFESAIPGGSLDVHSGYFYGPVTVDLIAKLATLGLRQYLTPAEVSARCAPVCIRVLLAPEHFQPRRV